MLKAKVFHETVINNKYMHWKPHPAQANLLLCDDVEVLWGGSAGPGKSVGLLFAASQYVEVPQYSALLLRKTFKQLTEAKALIDLSKIWFAKHRNEGTAHWNEKDKLWTFPSGAKIKFGYLDSVNDKYNFQGAEYQFIGFDELTQFDKGSYEYLYSRLRKTLDNPVPLRMWSTSNPGGYGHEWVKERFIPDDYRPETMEQYYYKEHEMYDGSISRTVFIPAFIDDNPSLDKAEYMKSLAHLDTVTRNQLMNGDWTARHEGMMFRREWIIGEAGERLVDSIPFGARLVRYWDCAATEKKFGDGKDPDYTASMFLGEKDGLYYIGDITRFRGTPKQVEDHIRKTALKDKMRYRERPVHIWMEEERGQSGKAQISHYRRNVLAGYWFKGDRSTGDKKERATTPSVACEAGVVYAVKDCENIGAFLNEIEIFPHGRHDDMCFVAGTKIITDSGEKPIENITLDDLVLTRNGYRRVLNCGLTGTKPVYELGLNNGYRLIGTGNHPIFTHRKGYISMDALSGGYNICILNQLSLTKTPIIEYQTQNNGHTESTTNITINGKKHHDTFTEIYGYSTTEKSQKDNSSTTLTATHLTTNQKTLNHNLEENICLTTMESGLTGMITTKNSHSTWNEYDHSQKNGTRLRKEKNGTQNTGKTASEKRSKKEHSTAKSVVSNSRPSPPEKMLGFVHQSVEQNHEATRKHALSAERNSQLMETRLEEKPVLKYVAVNYVRRIVEEERVYNLTVEGEHEYFANGILVHNCDAFSGAFNKVHKREAFLI